ncbi:hypothetical protein [Thermococcus sp.]|uniref:hypothetical protein n=1 Tax=Thermococcus sp. TaxID=35749 RepID=UPI00262B4290|nr:hypothetical protein [Thermococcus sp.]
MMYDSIIPVIEDDPLGVSEEFTRDYLRRIFEFHFKRTPYWRKVARKLKPDLDEIFQGSIKEVFEKVFNAGLMVDEDYLRANWPEFVPENYPGRIRFYQSSGTTRERAIGHWDGDYLRILLPYMRKAIDELYHLDSDYSGHQMRAIAHGPYGWYQDEISELVWSYGGTLYFIGMETEGLKRVLKEQGLDAVLRLLDPLTRYTHRVMERDMVNTVRTAPQLMTLFEKYSEDIETAMVSGVGVNEGFLDYLKATFGGTKIIPLYGYYLFGDLVGIYRNGRFHYYSNYPVTIIFPLKREDGFRVVKRGERGTTAFIIARPEVLVVKLESETAERVPPAGPFRWDGFGEPSR